MINLDKLKKLSFKKIDGSKLKHPKVVQLPITYNCNAKCIMCNIWKMDHSNEMDTKEFSKFLKDPIFKEVTALGINGGEPSLVTNLPEFAAEILKLPKLKSLNLISHGFSQKLLLKSLKEIYKLCKEKNINFHVSISLDGVGETHNIVRGKSKVFEKTSSTIKEITSNKNLYCDSIDVGCTIVKQNIDYLIELDMYAKQEDLDIKYRLGIDNKRIESDKLRNAYSVIFSPLKQSAQEFFHSRYWKTKNLQNKFKYFSIYYWLVSENKKRLLGCNWKDEGITMDARGELYYCAVASDRIGSLRENKGEDIFFNDKNIDYRKSIIKKDCDNCIHDYNGRMEIKNLFVFIKHFIFEKTWSRFYLIKSKFI